MNGTTTGSFIDPFKLLRSKKKEKHAFGKYLPENSLNLTFHARCARECARSAKSILIQRAYLRWREFQDDRLEKKNNFRALCVSKFEHGIQ